MISREEAEVIAREHILASGLGAGVREVSAVNELRVRAPSIYGGPDLAGCWIAYAERRVTGLGPSAVVLVSMETGDILYSGSANDEG